MHLNDGELRAYLDQEMSAEKYARIQTHLDDCMRCQQRSESLRAQAERVTSHIENLEPDINQNPISPALARARLTARLEGNQQEQINMWQRLTNRVPRPAWVTLAVVAVLAISLAFAPVRAIASSFLGLFRVEQIQVIEIDESELSNQLETSSEVANLMGENVQVKADGEPQEVSDVSEASTLAGFDVRLPSGMDGDPLLTVQPGGSATFNVDMELVEAVLAEMGRADIKLPPELDGESVTITIPAVVVAEYGECRVETSENPEHAVTPPPKRPDDCKTLMQVPSPTISAPPELNINEIGQAYLQLLGMEADEAAQLANTVDWTTTLIIPIPRYDTEYIEVDVGEAKGTLVTRQGYYPFYILLWIEDGIVYALRGSGDPEQAIAIANSLE